MSSAKQPRSTAADVTRQGEVCVVREVYDGNGAHEIFALELERYLESGASTIIIEPAALGDETARWIAVGNCLHKTAVLTGFGALFAGWAAPDKLIAWAPLSTISLACTAIYTASWQFDPCCQYQVELDSGRLSRLMLDSAVSSTPIVLVRRNDSRRKVLHTTMSLLAGAMCIYRAVAKNMNKNGYCWGNGTPQEYYSVLSSVLKYICYKDRSC